MTFQKQKTFNVKALHSLKTYKLTPSRRLGSEGSGCFLDPPNYPSYFLQSVYTEHGNSPGRGVQTVIEYQDVLYVLRHSDDWKTDPDDARFKKRLHRIWDRLPLEHERVQLWIKHCYSHLRNCYIDDSLPGRDKIVCGKYGIRIEFYDPPIGRVVKAIGLSDTLSNQRARNVQAE